MALELKMANAAVNAQADALARLLDNGWLYLFTRASPLTADAAATVGVLVSKHRFAFVSAPAAVNGVLSFAALSIGVGLVAPSAQPLWYRAIRANGSTPVMQGSVGVGRDFDCQINDAMVKEGAVVQILLMSHAVPK